MQPPNNNLHSGGAGIALGRLSGMSSPVNVQNILPSDKTDETQNENQVPLPANSRQKSLDLGIEGPSGESLLAAGAPSKWMTQNSSSATKQTAMVTMSTGGGLIGGMQGLQVGGGPKLEKRANSVACVGGNSQSVSGQQAVAVNKSYSEDHHVDDNMYHPAKDENDSHYHDTVGAGSAVVDSADVAANARGVAVGAAPSVRSLDAGTMALYFEATTFLAPVAESCPL